MNKVIRHEAHEVKNYLGKFKRQNLKGASGQIIKNSSYQLATNLIAKVGSLIFTVIIARLLAPKLFGLYSLALSTIILFSVLSDLGIGTTFLTFASKALGENKPQKAKAYFKELLKYKVYLLALSSFAVLSGGYVVTEYYYAKPIYYALVAGALYIPVVGLIGYLSSAFQAENNYRYPMFKEVVFQVTRFTIVPLGILFLMKTGVADSVLVGAVILLATASYLVGLLYLKILANKKIEFLKQKAQKLNHSDKFALKKFILPLSLTALGGMFFGYIDTLMLGHYVSAIFIGYYSAAFGLIGASVTIVGFLAGGALPVFSRENRSDLNKIFKKVLLFTFLAGFLAFIFTFVFAKYILLIYGASYLPATAILQVLSILLIIGPAIQIYNAYFVSIKKPEIIAGALVISTITNVILNVIFISYGIKYGGMMGGVYGAVMATVASRGLYLLGVVCFKMWAPSMRE